MKRILALIFSCVFIASNNALGLFFLLFYPYRIGVPVFIALIILALFALYVFIFILKRGFALTEEQETLKNEKEQKRKQAKKEKLQIKINKLDN